LQGIYFYGAGCINEPLKNLVRNSLNRYFHCPSIAIQSDLMAAARSLCQDQEGIACILGTGCNSGFYNGREIARQVSPLGYILGDEGSGAVMGRKLLADVLKKQMPEAIIRSFFETYALTPEQILERVYKRPFPNRFLAQFTHFILNNLSEPAMQDLVKNTFGDFFSRNVRQYPEAERLPIHFTGGVAWHFRDLLKASAAASGFITGSITMKPMEGLIRYHLNNPTN
jgi:N-acetylglucosamine kinase-like BadF-type ATPase